MKRFLIQLTNSEPSYYDAIKEIFYLYKEEYTDLLGILNTQTLINDFNRNTIVSCDICDSITINAKYFYLCIQNVFEIIDGNRISLDKYPHWDTLYDDLYEIRDHLIAIHLLSDEEWGIYLTVGLPDLNVVSENNEELTDTEGNLFVFVCDEIGILTDPACSCNQLITRPGRSID